MKKITILLSMMFFGILANSQVSNVDLNSPVPVDPAIKIGKLKNGMTYYIMKNSKPEHRAELRLAVNVGSTQENDDQMGLAHFTEHMAFNGTSHFAKNDLVDYIESIGSKFGADLNAYTSFDETVYMLQIPTDSSNIIDKSFQILEDWAHNLTFDSIEIDKERGVVTEEWRLGQGAQERMRRQYWPTLFKDSRYAVRLPIGKKEILQNCSYETLRSFYRDWYRPENMAIVVIGDIDIAAMENKIINQFQDIPRKENPRKLQSFSVPDNKGVVVAKATDKEATFTSIQMIYKLAKDTIKTLGDYKKDIIADLYNNMLNARLRELSQNPNPPFTRASSSYHTLVRTKNAYSSSAIVKDGGIERGIEALAMENQRVKQFGFTPTELERAKKELLRYMEKQYSERDKTDSRSFTRSIVSNFLEADPIPGIEFEHDFYSRVIPSITVEDVNVLAKKWINEDNAIVIITAPDKVEATIPSDEKIKEILKNVTSAAIHPYEDNMIDKPLLAKKPTPGTITVDKTPKEFGITTWKLSNGITVNLKPTEFKNDEISFSSFSFGGTSLYEENDYLNAAECASIVDNGGLGEFDAIHLQKLLAGKVANVSPFISDVSQGMNGHCSPQDAETMFQMIYLYFTNVNRSPIDFNAYIDKRKSLLQNRSSSPDAAFQDTIRTTMAQYDFRSRPLTLETLNQIRLDRVYDIFSERFADPNGMTFTFVGNFTSESIKPLVENYLAGIPSKMRKETFKDRNLNPPKGVFQKYVKKGVEPKSSVSIKLTNSFVYNRKNRNDLRLLMNLVSIKLREQMREEKSGVYGVRASPSMSHYPKQTYELNFGWGCAPENVDMLISTMWEVIEKIKSTGCDDKDLLKIRETAIRERELALKENNFWLNAMNYSAMDNENIAEINDYSKYLSALKGDDFKRLANQYLVKDNVATFILRPEK